MSKTPISELGPVFVSTHFCVGGINIPLDTLYPPKGVIRKSRLLFVYGGAMDKQYHSLVRDTIGQDLACLGIVGYYFDFRSNLPDAAEGQFGLYDRLEDAKAAFNRVIQEDDGRISHLPLSVLGLSMGGYLAARIASEYPEMIKNLILIAPGAYCDEACQPDVKFGSRFSEIIRKWQSWRTSSIFWEVAKIRANVLMISFADDLVTPEEIARRYHVGFLKSDEIRVRHESIPGFGHGRTLVDNKKRAKVVNIISKFLA